MIFDELPEAVYKIFKDWLVEKGEIVGENKIKKPVGDANSKSSEPNVDFPEVTPTKRPPTEIKKAVKK